MATNLRTLTAQIATAVRTGRPTEADWLRTELRAEKLAEQIRTATAQTPPFTDDQLTRLRALFDEGKAS